jgi:hypothetical protein
MKLTTISDGSADGRLVVVVAISSMSPTPTGSRARCRKRWSAGTTCSRR